MPISIQYYSEKEREKNKTKNQQLAEYVPSLWALLTEYVVTALTGPTRLH